MISDARLKDIRDYLKIVCIDDQDGFYAIMLGEIVTAYDEQIEANKELRRANENNINVCEHALRDSAKLQERIAALRSSLEQAIKEGHYRSPQLRRALADDLVRATANKGEK